MNFTVDQFKEWVQETFPDNTARAIAENNFRDGLNAMADFVFETNSTAFIQESIGQAQAIKEDTLAAAAQAQADRALTELARQVAEVLKNETLVARNQSLAQVKRLGGINPVTNDAGIVDIPPAGTEGDPIPSGAYYEVNVAGKSPVNGLGLTAGVTDVSVGGRFIKQGTAWQYQPPIDTGFEIANELAAVIKKNPYLGIYFPIVDLLEKLLLGFDPDGSLFVPKFRDNSIAMSALKDIAITYAQLSNDAKGYMMKPLDPLTGYCFGIVDNEDGMLLMIRNDSTVYIPKLDFTMPDDSVGLAQLTPAARKMVERGGSANPNERVIGGEDELARSKVVMAGASTHITGAPFVRLANLATPSIGFLNQSGVSIDIRKTSGLLLKGLSRRGSYAVPAIAEGTRKGNTSSATPPTVGLVAGDYYRVGVPVDSGTITIDGVNYNSGDLAVFNGATFDKKAAPQPVAGALLGYWWNVTTAGVFDGVSYNVGDTIYLSAIQSAAGPKYRSFSKGVAGEYFLAGEFTPGPFVAPTTAENTVFIADSAGTFEGKEFIKCDMLVRKAGTWCKVGTEPVTTVANGSFFTAKTSNLNEYEIRRTDALSGTPNIVQCMFEAKSLSVPIQSSDDIVGYTDSMGQNLLGLAAALPDRTVTIRSFGGATSQEILSMQLYDIANGDPYRSRLHIFYHGQNNGANVAAIKDGALRMLQNCGARDRRFLFLSILGSQTMTYDAGLGRMVCANLENAHAGLASNVLVQMEKFYEDLCPGNYINTRKLILASAASSNKPDPFFPGKTEAQVAALYGIVPVSYHYDYTTAAFQPEQLVFQGYRTVAGAPAGGADFDYYVNTVDAVGDPIEMGLWVKLAGTWTRINMDHIHLTTVARPIYTNAVTNWLTTNKM